MDELHKCRTCSRQIPAHIPCCIYCKQVYRALNVCWWCGEKPRKDKSPNGQHSQYCVACIKIKNKGILPPDPRTRTISGYGSESHGRSARSPQQSAHLPPDTDE